MTKGGRLAYVATCDQHGFAIGMAEENEPGYWPLPSFGTFQTYEAASEKAQQLNQARGLDLQEAANIVASSMRAQNDKEKA